MRMGFDRHRVMEVFAKPANGPGRIGSGYLVNDASVLTAGHVVAGLPIRSLAEMAAADDTAGRCQVRPLGVQEWVSGSVLWRDHSADVALIGLSGDRPLLPPGSPVPRWGVVDGVEPVSCGAVGFPWAQEQSDRVRDTEQLIGFAAPLSTVKAGHLSLTAVSAAPRSREHGSPWAGMSGAAVFVGPYLVGVVIVDPVRFGEDRLVAAATSPLCADARFAELTDADAAVLRSVQPRFRLAISQQLSVLLQPPYRPLPADLTFARAPVRLLLPEHGVVPFCGREQPSAELQSWCQGPDRFALRVVTGDGGAGKTRLAADLAVHLIRDGWDAGFSDQDAPDGATRLELDRPTLVIVDDADLKVTLAGSLVTTLATQSGGPRFRLLLLARHLGAWWAQLNTITQYLAEDLAADTLALQAGQLLPDEQRSHHDAAYEAFGAQLESPASETSTTPGATLPLSGDDFANPLLVHMNALLTVLGDATAITADTNPASRRARVLRRILDRERRRWEPVANEFGDTVTIQAVAVATLLAPPNRASLHNALNAIPSVRETTALQRERIAEWLRDTYPGGGWVAPLRPDLVTEQLLAETPDLPELVLSAAERAPSAEQSAHLLGELTRAAPNRAVIRDALAVLLESRLPALLSLAMSNVTSPLPVALELAVRQTPQRLAAAGLINRLPERSTALASLAATLTGQAVAAHRELAAAQPDAFRPDLATVLTKLSSRLADLGRREEALTTIEEAVGIYRELAAAQPDAFRPDLATGLNSRSNRLVDLGRREEALTTIEEAVAIRRELAAAQPAAFRPGLAGSLTNQSNCLGDLGRREEALTTIEEAVGIYRELAAAQPDAFRPGLATALNNQSNRLADLGRREEALTTIKEAVAIRRELAAAQPDAFQPDLAGSLTNQSNRLADLGRREEALTTIKEAVAIRRELAAARPAAFRPGLAGSLTNQSNWLADLGRREEALTTIDEAVGIYRELAAARSAAFRPDLARALSKLSSRLADLGRREEALTTIEEAVGIYRELAAATPAAFRPGLATALNSRSNRLVDLGRREEALTTIEEAVGIYRELAAATPAAFRPGLAGSLTNQSNCLGDLGRREEALTTIEEAVGIYRELAAAQPDAFRPGLATALNNRSNRLADLGRREEALTTIEEAVAIRRELAAARPAAFRPGLAGSLTNQSIRLADLGRREEALTTIEEAVAIRWELAAAQPDAFRPGLAGSLTNQSNWLADLGRREEALTTIEEAAGIYRELAAAQPDAFRPDLATVLTKLSSRLADLGRREEALTTIEEAVAIRRELAAARPAAV